MLWVKLSGDGEPPRYTCSHCKVLLFTVEGFALPTQCKACGTIDDGAGGDGT